MPSYTRVNNIEHTYQAHQLLSKSGNYGQKHFKQAPQETYRFSYQQVMESEQHLADTWLIESQYMAAFPTGEQLRSGLTWDEALRQNLQPHLVHRKVSSGSTATTTSHTSTKSFSTMDYSMTSASTMVDECTAVPASIRTLLIGSTPLPRYVSTLKGSTVSRLYD